ncbi:hypothetical protein AAZX31_12G201500 [Glycine max]|uniref:Uncharacterized protein n=1 Tax=Glycine max TaxID=3847 RepID=K7LW78_SOYBN|nr:vascular-related unknown protein 4 [Glycine max]XP_040863546.1 vascular-related unknown protein 4 [Glycine max]KAG4968871.1 hypothetical protein JHK87_034522 [Glycine soja]KAH1144258.1 hypothetical protein GYH30_034475 [Glycine max]KAH1144259.1 hypothetical protein GYH30_034475 [Glycine max]KAH1222679.1 Vascular-related protein 1 [Glycine max]KRH27079.1 hypothetical protein GLYMA_12G212900v4 [Glycine max]|eukprot:XP_006592877.1 vascular-related unknown protein 4 [Glycine max]
MSTISKDSSSSKNMTSECDSSEESGWTKYFEDFFDNHNIDDDDDQKCSMSSFSGVDSYYSTSFVSDSATKKLTDNTQAEEYDHQSSLKKRKKIKTALVDDALEDTASSPIKGSKEKRNTLGERDERKEMGFNEGDNDHTKLKNKGLCLVPLSMIVKYI